MRIRDALESDAEALAASTDRPEGVVRNMIHDRSVRVAAEGKEDDGDDGNSTVAGFVAFDVRGETVHVTDFDGGDEAIRLLFEEPRRFARREGMSVEVVVPNDERTGDILEDVGFESAGAGPRFEGRETTRYAIDSVDLDGAG